MKTLTTFIFCLLTFTAQAQFVGTVLDEKNQPLPGAVVKLDHRSTLTDAGGHFSVDPALKEISITCMGYLPDTVRKIIDGMTIVLRPDAKALKEVLIKGRQPILKQTADRTIITVNAEVLKLADNALSIINLAPGLAVSDNEDAILMSGKSEVQVMLNDQLVKMTARDLAKYLKALPAGGIKSVEVMANPPAKYEVNGQTGLINIRTRPLKGWSGSFDGRTSQSTYNWTDISGILNYGSEHLAINGYAAWHSGGYLTRDTKYRPGLVQQQEQLDKWSDPVFRLSVDYQLGKKSTLGALFEQEASTNNGSYRVNSGTSITDGHKPNLRHWADYNLNYRYGEALTVDLDRVTYAIDDRTQVLTTGAPSLDYHTQTHIDFNTLKADYSLAMKEMKLEAGLKLSAVRTDNDLNADRFDYTERVGALYGSLSRDYGKWAWHLGLRAEQTRAMGSRDSSYFNLLPAAFLSWHNFRLSLSRRIRRPDYSDLNPFTYQLDPLNYRSGNPALRAQRTDNTELSYTLDGRITLTGSYARTADYFSPLIRQSGQVLIELPGNAGVMRSWNFDLNYPLKVSKFWNILNKVNVANDRFDGQLFQGDLTLSNWHYQLSSTQTFTLPKKYSLQISGRYTSAQQQLIYAQQSSANFNMSVSKKLGDQASLRLAVSDVFQLQRSNTSVNFGTLQYSDYGTFESRRVSLAFNWRFGNQKVPQVAERESGASDEKSRSGK